MSADTIYYNYGANHEQLDGINANLNDARTLQDDVNKVFAALDGVYEGQAALALHAAQRQLNNKMEECIADLQVVQQCGVESQYNNAALDNQCANSIST